MVSIEIVSHSFRSRNWMALMRAVNVESIIFDFVWFRAQEQPDILRVGNPDADC